MNIGETVHPASRAKWRAWLKANHKKVAEIWLVYDKGASRNVTYAAAVEEALCFGWIDGIVKPINEKQYAQRFTPRKNESNWSAVNQKRFNEMVEAGLMTEAGRAVFRAAPLPVRWKEGDPLPGFVKFKGAARKNFEALPRSAREQYVRWIIEAKQEATRKARLAKAAEKLAKNERRFP